MANLSVRLVAVTESDGAIVTTEVRESNQGGCRPLNRHLHRNRTVGIVVFNRKVTEIAPLDTLDACHNESAEFGSTHGT